MDKKSQTLCRRHCFRLGIHHDKQVSQSYYSFIRQAARLDEVEQIALTEDILTEEEVQRLRTSLEQSDLNHIFFASVNQVMVEYILLPQYLMNAMFAKAWAVAVVIHSSYHSQTKLRATNQPLSGYTKNGRTSRNDRTIHFLF